MRRNVGIFIWAAIILLISCLGGILSIEQLSSKVIEVEPEFVLCYGEVNSGDHIMLQTAEYFAEQVKKLSDGKVLVEIYPSGQLGDDARCYQAMQMGALDLYRGNSASLTGEETPMISMLALPYLFEGREHFWNVCNSEIGKEILENVQESCKGMRAIAFVDEGTRNFFTTERAINRLDDIQGMEMRIQVSDVMTDTMLALGAIPVPMEYVELYSALSAKTVDGAENPPISYYYNKFYKAAPFYVKDAHTYAPGVILISEITWEKLGEQYQRVIMEAAKLTQGYNAQEIQKAEDEAYEVLKDEGVFITELLDPENWREAVEPVYEKYGAQFQDMIEKIETMK